MLETMLEMIGDGGEIIGGGCPAKKSRPAPPPRSYRILREESARGLFASFLVQQDQRELRAL